MKNSKILAVNINELKSKIDLNLRMISLSDDEIGKILKDVDLFFVDREKTNSQNIKHLKYFCFFSNFYELIDADLVEDNELLKKVMIACGIDEIEEEEKKRFYIAYKGGFVQNFFYINPLKKLGCKINENFEVDKNCNLMGILIEYIRMKITSLYPEIEIDKIKCIGFVKEGYSRINKNSITLVFGISLNPVFLKNCYNKYFENSKFVYFEAGKKYFERKLLKIMNSIKLIFKQQRKMFLVFSHTLTEEQINDAKSKYLVSDFIYLPEDLQKIWSNIRPTGSLDTVSLDKIVEWLKNNGKKDDFVLVQGDFGAVHYLVKRVNRMNMIPVYSTTIRESMERIRGDGTVEKINLFKHKGFRRYV